MRTEIKRIFDRWIEEAFKDKHEVKKFLLRHERKDLCLNYLAAEIYKMEKGLVWFDTTRHRKVIQSVARMFCDAVLKHREEQLLTESEKKRRMDIGKTSDAEEFLKEVREEVKSL